MCAFLGCENENGGEILTGGSSGVRLIDVGSPSDSTTSLDLSQNDEGPEVGHDVATVDLETSDEVLEDSGSGLLDLAEEMDTNPWMHDLLFGCDEDEDGYLAESCGGNDCNDAAYSVNPSADEVCDQIDNDCNGLVNDELICSFYAHTATELYQIDPFRLTAELVGEVPTDLWDFDTHPDGTLYGIKDGGLWRFDEASGLWEIVAAISIDLLGNGFAIDPDGGGYITALTSLYSVNVETGLSELVGDVSYVSSGDCVVDKAGQMYMSAFIMGTDDHLIQIDSVTADSTDMGSIGFRKIYGLTAGWDNLYGVTYTGDLIEIDQLTGIGTLVHNFPGLQFFGAASTPGR
jgi:hypothetical protein